MNIYKLHLAIAAICPIDGVSSDGRIDFKPEATTEQRAAAQSILDNWIDTGDDRFVTKVSAYNRISAIYGDTKLEQVFDILDALPRKDKRIYDDAQDIDCSNAQVIAALQSVDIDPTKILY